MVSNSLNEFPRGPEKFVVTLWLSPSSMSVVDDRITDHWVA